MSPSAAFLAEHFSRPPDATDQDRLASVAPPPPVRRAHWPRVWRHLRQLIREPAETDAVFELLDAVGGRGDERTFERFLATPPAGQLLREKPSLVETLANRDYLSALPSGSFGHAYLDFARENGFAADGLLQARDRGMADRAAELDADRLWFFDRLNVMHDLWHVLTEYGTDEAGEGALLAFSRAQGVANRGLLVLLMAAACLGGVRYSRELARARRRARATGPLLGQVYETLLPLPLAEVRRRLGVPPPRDFHPDGVPQSHWNEGTPKAS